MTNYQGVCYNLMKNGVPKRVGKIELFLVGAA